MSMHDASPSDGAAADDAARPASKAALYFWMVLALAALAAASVATFRTLRDPGVGQRLPGLQLVGLTGTAADVTLADVQGKVCVINFWGTWCPPCVLEFPHIIGLRQRYGGRPDFMLLAVSSSGGDDPAGELESLRQTTESFLRSTNYHIPTYADVDRVTRDYIDQVGKFVGFPTTIVLDRNGVIRGQFVGYKLGDERKVDALIASLLGDPSA